MQEIKEHYEVKEISTSIIKDLLDQLVNNQEHENENAMHKLNTKICIEKMRT